MNEHLISTFMFTGQGAQYPDMGRGLRTHNPYFEECIQKCYSLFKEHGIYLEKAIGTEEVNTTLYTQPALFSLEYALACLWQSWGLTPNILIGHSIGELVACTFSGVISLPDACQLVSSRATLMNSIKIDGGMLAILADYDQITPILPKEIDIAGYNTKKQVVVAGATEDLSRFKAHLRDLKIKSIPLVVSHPFHSRYMQPILNEFINTNVDIAFNKANIPIVSNITGNITINFDIEYFAKHIVSAVQFYPSMQCAQKMDCNLWIECGPVPMLINMIKKEVSADQLIPSFQSKDPLDMSINDSKQKLIAQDILHGNY